MPEIVGCDALGMDKPGGNPVALNVCGLPVTVIVYVNATPTIPVASPLLMLWVLHVALALTACTVPAAGKPGFELGEDEIELGVGIHGEPGRARGQLVPARDIAGIALDAIHADLPLSGDVLVMVNGMGGTPLIELYVVFAAVSEWLSGHGVTIVRSLVGNYITSLEMAGCSVTVCRLTPQLTELWDAPVETPALRWGR